MSPCMQVVEAIIQVKWSTYGFLFHTFMLLEQLLHIAVIIAYAALYAFGDTFCLQQFGLDGTDGTGIDSSSALTGPGGSGTESIGWNITHLFNCSNGEAMDITHTHTHTHKHYTGHMPDILGCM